MVTVWYMTDDMGTRRDTWRRYVHYVTAGDTQAEVARKVGVNQTTISNWRGSTSKKVDPARIDNGYLANLARAYGRNPLEALVASGQMELVGHVEAILRQEPDSIRLLTELGLVHSGHSTAQQESLSESG